MILIALILIFDIRELAAKLTSASSMGAAMGEMMDKADFRRSGSFLMYLAAIIPVSMFIGQMITLPLFVVVYLRRWGKYSWKISLLYAAVAGTFVFGFYDQIMHLFFYPPILLDWLGL